GEPISDSRDRTGAVGGSTRSGRGIGGGRRSPYEYEIAGCPQAVPSGAPFPEADVRGPPPRAREESPVYQGSRSVSGHVTWHSQAHSAFVSFEVVGQRAQRSSRPDTQCGKTNRSEGPSGDRRQLFLPVDDN